MKTHPDAIIFPNNGIGITDPPDGLTKREYFALHLMQSLIVNNRTTPSESIAESALDYADALIRKLNSGR